MQFKGLGYNVNQFYFVMPFLGFTAILKPQTQFFTRINNFKIVDFGELPTSAEPQQVRIVSILSFNV